MEILKNFGAGLVAVALTLIFAYLVYAFGLGAIWLAQFPATKYVFAGLGSIIFIYCIGSHLRGY